MPLERFMRKTFIKPNCAPCLVETALKFLREGAGDDDELIIEGLQKALDLIQKNFTLDGYTFFIGNEVARMITVHLGKQDIFHDMKKRSNALCNSIYPLLLAKFDALPDLDARLAFALETSVAGNIIDVGTAGHEFSLDKDEILTLIDSIHVQGFAVDDRHALMQLIRDRSTKEFLLMLDNAGEIVFDKLLVKLLKTQGKRVSCMVKGRPIANDATVDDLRETGMDAMCDEILETSIASLGYTIPDNEPSVIARVNEKD
nr:ARMT1-like domain-containing protein [Candidatus Sigynarchaeota archaeon]